MPDHLPPRVRSTPRATAPYPSTPVRQFSFTDFSVNNPATPQPGNNIDSEYDRSNASISQIINWLGISLNTDGTLATGSVGAQQIAPGVFDFIATDAINQVQPLVDDAQAFASSASASSTTAQAAATAANTSNAQAQGAASTAQTSAGTATTQAQAANSFALAAGNAAVNAANDANDTAGDVAICTDYGVLTQAWAEHMPDPIPPNILAVMGVTGDHWSSRWWATKAEAAFGSLASLYLGAWPSPPLTTSIGDPIPLGAIYYNTTTGQPYVWNGTEWVPFYAPTKAYLLTLLYHATANQTVFPLTHPDLGGNTYVMSTVNPEPLEIYTNGDRVPQNAPNPGFGAWDVNSTTSTVTFVTPLAAGAVVQVDILAPASTLTPTRVQTEALLDFNVYPGTGTPGQIDGIRTSFPLVLNDGSYTVVSAGSAQELFIMLDGVVQQPGIDFSIGGGNISFAEAPVPGARAWGLWYGPGHYGPDTGNGYLPISGGTLTGSLTLAADPTLASHAATKRYVDSAAGASGGPFLALAGGTLTGPLTLSANAINPMHAVAFQQVSTALAGAPFLPISGGTLGGNLTLAGNATSSLHAVPLQQLNTAVAGAGVGTFLPLAGGTVSGATTFNSTLSSGALTANGAATITGTNMLQVGNNASVNNFVRLLPTASGGTPALALVGVDANIGLNITPQGIGVVAIPRLQLGAANFTLSGTFATNQSPLSISTNVLGTSTDPYRNITQISINNDNVVAGVIQALGVNHNYGGAAAKGSRIAFATILNQNAATQNTNNTFYQGCQFSATAAFQEPGSVLTRTGARGILFSGASTATLSPGAINYSGLAGWEFDIVAGAQPYSLLGLSVVRLTGGFGTNYQAAEPSMDSGFRVGSAVTNAATWVNGYTVTSPSSAFALDTVKGTAFKVFPGQDYPGVKPAASVGIDLSYVAFSSAAWHSQGAIIDGSGHASLSALSVGNWDALVSSAGLTLGSTKQIALSAALASGGALYSLNEQFSFAGNGRGIVTGVSGNAVTAVAILEYPTAASPPSNPVATTSLMFAGAGQNAGSGLTLTLTWSAANGLGFNGAAPVVKPTVTGAKNSNVALASLVTALAAYGLVTDSTTA